MPDDWNKIDWDSLGDLGVSPEGVTVLLYDEDEETFRIGAWDDWIEEYDMYGCNPDHCKPTHWRPLPEPPDA